LQAHVYGGVKHAFTNPEANDEALGAIYNPAAEQQSWQAMKNFFAKELRGQVCPLSSLVVSIVVI